jgi:hypothetical protein
MRHDFLLQGSQPRAFFREADLLATGEMWFILVKRSPLATEEKRNVRSIFTFCYDYKKSPTSHFEKWGLLIHSMALFDSVYKFR